LTGFFLVPPALRFQCMPRWNSQALLAAELRKPGPQATAALKYQEFRPSTA
jgi:hypothetical protein